MLLCTSLKCDFNLIMSAIFFSVTERAADATGEISIVEILFVIVPKLVVSLGIVVFRKYHMKWKATLG